MLIPVNFLLSLICILLLLQRRDRGHFFQLLLGLCLVHSLIAGLAVLLPQEFFWRRLQPVTAAALPLLCHLALLQATGGPLRTGYSALVLAMMVACVLFFPQGIDVLMTIVWLGCAGLMFWRLRRGSVVPGNDGALTLRGWQALALLLIAVAWLDVIISGSVVFAAGKGSDGSRLVGNLLMVGVMSLLLLLARQSSPQVTPRIARLASPEDGAVMTRIEALMQDGLYREPQLSLTRLARKAGIPSRQVSAAINALHQQSVSHYINGWRIREAGDRLKGSGETVIEVMEHVGFQTKSNFNREFRRITGKTPTQWRKEAWEQAENH